MLKVKKNLKEEKEIEALKAKNATLQAKLDYIAMMTDVNVLDDEDLNE